MGAQRRCESKDRNWGEMQYGEPVELGELTGA